MRRRGGGLSPGERCPGKAAGGPALAVEAEARTSSVVSEATAARVRRVTPPERALRS